MTLCLLTVLNVDTVCCVLLLVLLCASCWCAQGSFGFLSSPTGERELTGSRKLLKTASTATPTANRQRVLRGGTSTGSLQHNLATWTAFAAMALPTPEFVPKLDSSRSGRGVVSAERLETDPAESSCALLFPFPFAVLSPDGPAMMIFPSAQGA